MHIVKNNTLCRLILKWLSLVYVTFTLGACATGPRIVDHAFEFDAARDSPDVEVLDYRYGESMNPGARPPAWALESGKIAQAASTHGAMRAGDALYVKWRSKSTGEVFKETVDLRDLPAGIENRRLYFIIGGQRLHVYLVSTGTPDAGVCRARGDYKRFMKSENPDEKMIFMFCGQDIIKIHPEQKKL